MSKPVAHLARKSSGNWRLHDLQEHLESVAESAAKMASPFGASEWAKLAGLWHDLGKYQPAFQQRIKSLNGYDPEAHIESGTNKQPHSTAGALHAIKTFGVIGRLLGYVIAGHHAGLPDWASNAAEGGKGSLNFRLNNADQEYDSSREALGNPLPAWLQQAQPQVSIPGGPEGLALWIRLVFSCLVDADFLDTEAFYDSERTGLRRQAYPSLEQLASALRKFHGQIAQQAADTKVNRIRADVLACCRKAALNKPGLFSLTVPTGGGKTLSSLAFALEHAQEWQKRRIIYAIPFTSIIEQTSDTFRAVFKEYPSAVLEHHSNLDPAHETAQNRLWAENWDRPIVVTTNVQLFESLFAARTSRCRKLHNLVNSVIVLDEAQQLPREFLKPVLHALDLLTKHYNVTVLFCTATQPALGEKLDAFGRVSRKGLANIQEIVPNPEALAQQLERVWVQPLGSNWETPTGWPKVAQQLLAQECVLAIVNRRADCRTLYDLLPPDSGRVHLSALMCGQHRSDCIAEIKRRLEAWRRGGGEPLRVVSTQLVEAGVDLDFPVVFRAMAGLDSIAQAAGRCNREGRSTEHGQVWVFKPEKPAPLGLLRQGEQTALELLLSEKVKNPLNPKAFQSYFDLLYSKGNLDEKGIEELEQRDAAQCEIQFRTVAERFQLIPNEGAQVVVSYTPAGAENSPVDAWLAALEADPKAKWVHRKLQRFTISIHNNLLQAMLKTGSIELRAGLYYTTHYDANTGLLPPDQLPHPADMIVD